MRNRLKTLGILAVFVAASFVGVKGSAAATGNVSVPMPGVGAVNINMAGGSNFAVNASPETFGLDQSSWADYEVMVGPTASIYTVFCWKVTVASSTTHQQINAPDWKCGLTSVIPNAYYLTFSQLSTLSTTATLDALNPTACQWFQDPQTCESLGAGMPGGGPPVEANMMPNFDPYVSQSLAFDVLTNWCSYLAPAGYDIVGNLGDAMNNIGAKVMGCAADDPTFTINGTMRTLASADTKSRAVSFDAKVQAGPTDCHVPKVKGLTLRKAKARLHRANCGASVRYVKGTRAGRVRYQPIKVGTGEPRWYKVRLAVVR